MSSREVLFEGLTEQEILNLPQQEVENMILLGEPLVFRAGSAVLLGSFKIADDRLVIELAQIEGGGEGVLVSLASLAKRYAKLRTLSGVEWIVHAVSCAKPNLKLRRVLEHRGFMIKEIEGIGEAYHLLESTADSLPSGMEEWQPATIEEVKRIVEKDLRECDAEQIATFKRYAVEPYVAPIVRYGKMESVVVIARRGDEVIYWEDVEDGFNVSPSDRDGRILEHWCNQDELAFALNAWVEGRGRAGNFGPAIPID